MNKTIFIWIGVFGVTFAALFFLIRAQTTPSEESAKIYPETAVVSATDHVRPTPSGAGQPALLVEYGDFQCPGCGLFEPIVEQLTKDFGDRLAVVFRNLPLVGIHSNAMSAARYAESAGLQGKYWEMHDMIFKNQKAWEKSDEAEVIFQGYGKDLQLDVERLKSDADSDAVKNKIQADISQFNGMGLSQSTPTFFLNGKRIQPKSYDEFKTFIEAAAPR